MMCCRPGRRRRRPSAGSCGKAGSAGGIQISASHNPPRYNGLKFFQRGGMVLGAEQGRALLDRWNRRDFRWASWDRLGRSRRLDDPDSGHLARVLETVDVAAIRRRGFKVVLDACHGSGGRLGVRLLEALGARAVVLGVQPDGRYDHAPEPTETNLKEFSAIVPAVGAAIGFAQDPDADRLAIVDETGRYIGEELTLALAARRRLEQARGPVVINLSTSRVTEDLAKRLGCPVFRTPVGEINVVERMIAEDALFGGEGNGGVIDPRIGYVRDSFAAMAHGPGSDGRLGIAAFTIGCRAAPVYDDQGSISDPAGHRHRGCDRMSRHSGIGSPRHSPTLAPIVAMDCDSSGTIGGSTSGPATPSRSSE